MPALQLALIGLGPQDGIRVQHTDDNPASLALILPHDDPQVALWLAALEEGVTNLGSNFSVCWVGYQMPVIQLDTSDSADHDEGDDVPPDTSETTSPDAPSDTNDAQPL